jgi:hypothetical protein
MYGFSNVEDLDVLPPAEGKRHAPMRDVDFETARHGTAHGTASIKAMRF